MHTVLQTQTSLGMSLTTAGKSGSVLGRIGAIGQGGTLAALVMIFLIFKFNWLSYGATFVILGVACFVGALAIVRFPHLHEGQLRKTAPKREPIVWSRHYRLYYWICMLDGARQQVFFSFGLWVLVKRFGLGVAQISLGPDGRDLDLHVHDPATGTRRRPPRRTPGTLARQRRLRRRAGGLRLWRNT